MEKIFKSNIEYVECFGTSIMLYEEPEDTRSTGTKVWESSRVLTKYLEINRNKLKIEGKKAIEIGAGCGLTGIALTVMGANSIITDLVPLLKKNLNLNNTSGKLSVKELDWTKWKEVAPQFKVPYDIVVDVVYNIELVDPLVEVLVGLTSPQSMCFIALEERDPFALEKFLEVSKKFFSITRIPKPKKKEYSTEFVTIYSFKKLNNNTTTTNIQ